jgi:hypothetical protein
LADHFRKAGRAFMDLSVLHDNAEAIKLYEKMGFERVPVYTVKKKNPINESLFIGPQRVENLNIYAKIIVDEARRRGIHVDIEDAAAGLFTLTLGGRSIACRESLSELTSAVAMSRCDDKALTHRLLAKADLNMPGQVTLRSRDDVRAFWRSTDASSSSPPGANRGRACSSTCVPRTRRSPPSTKSATKPTM